MKSQNQIILEHLRNVGPITRNQAMELYGITELNTRICNLRAAGHIISSIDRCAPNRYGRLTHFSEYKLVKEIETNES